MMRDLFWVSIDLSPQEHKKYEKVSAKLTGMPYLSSAFVRILASSKYSWDFKRKLVFKIPFGEESRRWGCTNLKGEDLHRFVKILSNEMYHDFDYEDIEHLLANPSFVSSLGTEHDAFSQALLCLTDGPDYNEMHFEWVADLVNSNLMSLEVAAAIIAANNASVLRVKRQYPTVFGKPNVPRTINEAPVIAWTRENYDLGDIPDSWVVKFLLPPD